MSFAYTSTRSPEPPFIAIFLSQEEMKVYKITENIQKIWHIVFKGTYRQTPQ